MLRNFRRALTDDAIQYEAPRHARFMSMFADGDRDKVASAIKSKGELYSLSKFPDQEVVRQARDDFDGFRTGTPAMQQIGADMQRFYGFNTGQPVTRELVSDAAQRPAEVLYQSATARPGPPARHPADIPDPFGSATVPQRQVQQPLGPQTNAYPESMPAGPNPQQQAAIDLKDDYVNHTVGYDVQQRYDSLITDLKNLETPKPKGFLLEDPLADAALWGGAALLAGGGIGRATAPEEQSFADPTQDERLLEAYKNGSVLF